VPVPGLAYNDMHKDIITKEIIVNFKYSTSQGMLIVKSLPISNCKIYLQGEEKTATLKIAAKCV
jgi:hypothetical protein